MDAATNSISEPLQLFDLKPNQRFENVIVAVVEKRLRQSNNGGPFLALQVRDCTDKRAAKWFSPPADIEARLNGTSLASISGIVDGSPAYMGDLKLSNIVPVETPHDLTPYMPPLPGNHKAHVARFNDLVRSIGNAHLKQLLRDVFQPELLGKFMEAPAAKNMHHAYRGGLMEHSGEVALLCDRAAATLPHINRDLLVTAALVHDIGKLEEMEGDLRAGEYTPAGQLVGHIVLGTYLVTAAAEKQADFPPLLKHELMHLILSHHGRPEHGAAKVPMNAEAIILSLCDVMSARVAQCCDAAGKGDRTDNFPKVFGWETSNIYVGSMREMMAQSDA